MNPLDNKTQNRMDPDPDIDNELPIPEVLSSAHPGWTVGDLYYKGGYILLPDGTYTCTEFQPQF